MTHQTLDPNAVAAIFTPEALAASETAWAALCERSGVGGADAAFGAVARHDILKTLGDDTTTAVIAGFMYRDNNGNGQFDAGEQLSATQLGLPRLIGADAPEPCAYADVFFFGPVKAGQAYTLSFEVDGIEPFSAEVTAQAGLNLLHVPVKPNVILTYIVSHSHFDPEWRDTYEGYLDRELPQLIDRVALLREAPMQVFNMDEELALRPLIERNPELTEEIRQRVMEGSIELKGIVTAGELTMPLGESMIRQLTEGEQWATRLLNFEVRPTTCWNVDCYGIPFQWPQILDKCGRKYFVMGEYSHSGGKTLCKDEIPFSDEATWDQPDFWLKGLDGTEILIHRSGYGTEPRGLQHFYAAPKSHLSAFNFEGGDFVPARRDLPELCEELNDTERAKKFDGQADPWGRIIVTRPAGESKFIITTSEPFFRAIENAPDLPHIQTESWLGFWDGCYESRAEGRLASRRIEGLLLAGESVASAAFMGGIDYPVELLRESWYKLLIDHHHDPQLTVMSPDNLFTEVLERYDAAEAEAKEVWYSSFGAMAELVRTDAQEGHPVIVANPLGWTQTRYFQAHLPEDAAGDDLRVVDSDGNEVPCQFIGDEAGRAAGFLATDVGGCGWRTYYIQVGQTSGATTDLIASEALLENPFVRVELDDGLVTRVVDKASGQDVFKATDAAFVNEIFIWEDTGCIAKIGPVKPMSNATFIARSSQAARTTRVVATGPARAILEVSFELDNGAFTQEIVLDAHTKWVDFQTTVDWDSKDIGLRRVRAAFPPAMANPRVWRDVPFGVMEWEQTEDVRPVNSWLGVSDADETLGGAVIHNGMSSSQVFNDVLWQTLFRSVRMPGEAADAQHDHRPDWQCGWDNSGDRSLVDGVNEYRCRVAVYSGSWREASVGRIAMQVVTPAVTCHAERQTGILGDQAGFLDVDTPEIVPVMWKKCDYSDATLLRLFNPCERTLEATLTVGISDLKAVEETNFREEHTGELTAKDGKVALSFGPFEIKTIRLVR